MIFISASLIKDYLVCQNRAHYRMNNSDQSESTNSMAIGSAVHESVEKCWDNEVDAIELAHTLIDKYNITENPQKVFSSINNFFKLYPPNTFSKDDEIEVFFKIPYKEDITWVGKIDRIHNNCIYDWKTSKNPPKSLDKDIQFIMYYLAYKMAWGKPPDKVIYASLTFQKEYLFKPKPEVLEKFELETIPEVIAGIRAKQQERNGLEKYRVCDYCSFRRYCFSEMEVGR